MLPVTFYQTFDLCTRRKLWLGGPGQCEMLSLPDTFARGQTI